MRCREPKQGLTPGTKLHLLTSLLDRVVSFTLRSLYSRRKRGLGNPRGWSERGDYETKSRTIYRDLNLGFPLDTSITQSSAPSEIDVFHKHALLSTLKMEAVCSYETLVTTYEIAWFLNLYKVTF
jgi:hypothetical protein